MSKMTAAVSPSFNARTKQKNPTRPPFFPSESASVVVATTIAAHRRPKTRDVASRYLDTSSCLSSSPFFQSSSSTSSPFSAKRCQSPTTITRTNRPATPSSTNRRPQSTGRGQSVTPRRDSIDRRGSGEVSAAQRMLLSSGRSLFASFQADSSKVHESRSNLMSSPRNALRGTLEKRKTSSTETPKSVGSQQEKSKLSEQWPRSLQPSCLSRSMDFTDTRKKPCGSDNGVARAVQNSMIRNRQVSRERITTDSSSSADFEKAESTRGDVIKARFSRSQYRLEPGSPVEKSNKQRTLESPKLIVVPKKIDVDSPALSPKGVATTRSQLFPKREQIRPASPSKYGITAASSCPRGTSIARGISPSRGVSLSGRMSPLRVRSSMSNSTPLNFAEDAKKEKIRENGVNDAHLLRLFHNRLLQWRFANAQDNVVISAQKIRAKKSLYNARISISKLYDSVIAKRIEIQQMKQNLKLISILNRQMVHLEEWMVMDEDYTGSLVGAAEALKGSTLCLPVDCGVNVQCVKGAICSAVDVMQAMASSICLLLPKVGKISGLAAELGRVNVKEQMMLEICRDLLNTISALEVTECSLRTQALQLQH